jgi:hypothetical protein
VELGKQLANKLLPDLQGAQPISSQEASLPCNPAMRYSRFYKGFLPKNTAG